MDTYIIFLLVILVAVDLFLAAAKRKHYALDLAVALTLGLLLGVWLAMIRILALMP